MGRARVWCELDACISLEAGVVIPILQMGKLRPKGALSPRACICLTPKSVPFSPRQVEVVSSPIITRDVGQPSLQKQVVSAFGIPSGLFLKFSASSLSQYISSIRPQSGVGSMT